MSENWITLIPVSEMEKLHTLALNFGGWHFSITVKRYFSRKSDHSNEGVCRKPIDRGLNMLPNEGSGHFLQLTTPELWKFFWSQLCHFLDKKKILIQDFEKFFVKPPQSPKRTKKCSSKYNGYRSAKNIAQNVGHVHNKNLNLYTRQIYFSDQNCAILRSRKITKTSR